MTSRNPELPKDSSWMAVIDQLEKDKEKILVQEIHIKGKKTRFESNEAVFFLGSLRCALTMEGFNFEKVS